MIRPVLFLLVSTCLALGCGDDGGVEDSGVMAGDSNADSMGRPDSGRIYVPLPFEPTPETRAYCPRDDDAIEAQITSLLAELSQIEKVRLLHGTSLLPDGGVWPVAGNDRLGVPGLNMLDGPRGLSAFSGKTGTAFPVAMLRGATWDPELERRVGAAIAREIRSAGADVLLAPTINILRHPRWGRAQETYSEDTHHMGALAVAFIEGVQSEGVLASVKHFAVNSIENTRHDVDVIIDERTLREVYLPHFRRAVVEARVASVMSAYNQVNGFYCDQSGHLLTEILKEEWGFAGFVESDWVLGTHGAAPSMLAGLDVEMPYSLEFDRIRFDISAGEMAEADLDRSVRRVLRAQLCFGLDDRERVPDDPSARETPEHLALAREVATRGIVLLSNRPADGAGSGAPPVLPLDRSVISRVAVLGRAADVENIGDTGSSNVTATGVTTALEGLVAAAGGLSITHVPGDRLDAAARAIVDAADAVIVVTGLLAADEGEASVGAGDRTSLALPAEEAALIAALTAIHPAVIVVLEGGAAFTVRSFADDIEALLYAGYPGAEGGHALAAILFGDEAPTGRLPFSMPRDVADLPPFDNESTRVEYGYMHGYRHLADQGAPAEFPFGFGLSYTEFALSELALSASTVMSDGVVEATVRVENTGALSGRETVQLYVSAIDSSVRRAPEDLRAFAQVELESGASDTVMLRLAVRDIAYWDVDTDAFVVEPIEYEVRVGRSSADPAALTARFGVTP
ncbi:MAG: glycoside hydrolase family 3 C-terminal domain-containing protein [Deltaproteobacteria bacterium]|nr:glycoside hydrolase family 3 C-terminal domain-containing protein [Deltaproteobacteria bacterium]